MNKQRNMTNETTCFIGIFHHYQFHNEFVGCMLKLTRSKHQRYECDGHYFIGVDVAEGNDVSVRMTFDLETNRITEVETV